MEKQENRDICYRDAKQLCAVIRKLAEELARAGMANNAARKRSTGCSEERSDEALRPWWRKKHKLTIHHNRGILQ